MFLPLPFITYFSWFSVIIFSNCALFSIGFSLQHQPLKSITCSHPFHSHSSCYNHVSTKILPSIPSINKQKDESLNQMETIPSKSIIKLHPIKGLLLSIIFTSTLSFGEITKAAVNYDNPSPVSSMALETAVTNLEQASTRSDVIQSMADLFEAAGTKTLIARSKYKYRINEAINTQHAKLGNEWDQVLSFESKELKRRIDPFRTADLSSYLKVAPFIGGALYLAALFVQQTIPELFIFAYPAAVFTFVAPIIFIVATL